jgi:probable blue pigment (indigoidine) exporter
MNKSVLPGLLFSILWATGAIAAKFGIRSADGLMLVGIRFICTGLLFAPYFLFHRKYRFMPKTTEWKPILIYGFLNSTATLGSFFAAQKYASAGISTLFTAVAPLLIALFSSMFLKRKLTRFEIWGMLIAFGGLILASATALPTATIKPMGILLLIIYIVAYALSSIYFSQLHVPLSPMVFNVWQVFTGGIMVLPFCWLFDSWHIYKLDLNFYACLIWLILVLSFVANLLWQYLVKRDTVSAATWLYLVPVFGYSMGYLLLGEKITLYAIVGSAMVIAGLIISKRKPRVRSSTA